MHKPSKIELKQILAEIKYGIDLRRFLHVKAVGIEVELSGERCVVVLSGYFHNHESIALVPI